MTDYLESVYIHTHTHTHIYTQPHTQKKLDGSCSHKNHTTLRRTKKTQQQHGNDSQSDDVTELCDILGNA